MTPTERAAKLTDPFRVLLGSAPAQALEGSIANALTDARMSGITDMDWPETKPAKLCASCRGPCEGDGLCGACCDRVAGGITDDGRMGDEGEGDEP